MRNYYLLFSILAIIALLALLASGYYFVANVIWNFKLDIPGIGQIVGILILMAAALVSNYQPIEMPQQGQVTVSSAIFFASMLLFGPFVAVIIAFFAFALVFIIGGARLNDLVYRFSKSVVCILITGLLYSFLNRLNPNADDARLLESWWNLLAIVISSILYVGLDTILSTLFVSTREDISFRHVWEWHWAEILPYYLCLIPLGILIAVIYNIKFPVSAFFIILPLYLLERIHNSIKLQSLLGNVPDVVRNEANKEVEAVVVKTEQVRKEIEKKNRELEILLETGEDLSKYLELDKMFEIIKEIGRASCRERV